MIELAPYSKIGLSMANPVMIAAGCAGYGNAYQGLIDLSVFGAVVTGPITLRPQRGVAQPRLVETTAGLILRTGGQNPGVKKVLRQYGPAWRRLGVPVIANLPADEPADLERTARAIACAEAVDAGGAIAAFELDVPPGTAPADLRSWLRALQEGSMLPILVRLPLDDAPLELVDVATGAAAALVVGGPPTGTAAAPGGKLVSGAWYSTALLPLTLQRVQAITAETDLPVIAAGGIASLDAARVCLAAGAIAVQLDSLLWVDPARVEAVAREIEDRGLNVS